MGRRILTVFVAVAVLAGAFAIGTAVATNDANTIHGCVNTRSGLVRVVSDSGDCKTNKERVLDWGIQGPPGNDGADGTAADIKSFHVTLTGGETDVVAIGGAGFELLATCDSTGNAIVELRHTTQTWRRPSLADVSAGTSALINTIGVLSPPAWSKGTAGRINAISDTGDVFLASEGNILVVGKPTATGRECIFAGAPHIQAAPQ